MVVDLCFDDFLEVFRIVIESNVRENRRFNIVSFANNESH